MPEQPELPDIEEGDEQRRDAMLLKALKTPPRPRKAKKGATPKPASSSAGKKRGPSA